MEAEKKGAEEKYTRSARGYFRPRILLNISSEGDEFFTFRSTSENFPAEKLRVSGECV